MPVDINVYNRPDPGSFGYNLYTGNGSTTAFAVPFGFPNKGKVAAGASSPYIYVYVDGVQKTYTFTDTANGTVNVSPAPANGAKVEVIRESGLGLLQEFTDGSTLKADTLAFDSNRQSYCIQDTYTRVKALGAQFDAFKAGTSNEYNFTGDGSTTVFTLGTETVTGDGRVIVFVNGLRQPTTAYNVALNGSGYTTVTFSAAPANSAAVSCLVWNSPVFGSTVIDDGSVTTNKIIDGAVTFAKLGMNATGTNNQAIMKRTGTWAASTILPSDISGLTSFVVANSLDTFAAPVNNLSLNNQRIINLANAIGNNDATTLTQVNSLISTATTALNLSTCRFVSGTTSVSSTSFGTVSFGFNLDTLILRVNNGNGDVGVRSTNATDTGGSSLNGSIYNPAALFLLRRSDFTSALRLQIRQNAATSPVSNEHEIEIQYVAGGFQVRRTGTVSTSYTLTYFAATNFLG